MNVVVVCVDCLRRDFIDRSYADTPFADRLVKRGTFFRDMHSTTTTTTPAVASLLTGTYSERNGVNSLRDIELSEDITTLAEVLSEVGYDTHAFVTGPLVAETELDRGFDTYVCRDPEEDAFSPWFETTIERLSGMETPFFSYLHFWEIHSEISVPDEFDKEQYGSIPYARALSALDRKLETLYEELPADTLFVLTGDHGESITTRNNLVASALKEIRDKVRWDWGVDTRAVERRINRLLSGRRYDIPDHYLEDGHGDNLYDFTTNVPFVLDGPDVPASTVDVQVRQIDVFPTILDYLDVDPPESTIDGASLLPPAAVEDRIAYTRGCGEALRGERNWMRAVRYNGEKYIEWTERDWSPELYQLETDPWQLQARIPENKSEYQSLYPHDSLKQSERLAIDERLEDLGYL